VSNEAWREAGLSSLEYCVMLLVEEGCGGQSHCAGEAESSHQKR
jgi:hypothetical protein